jgi:hypothetical protein
MGGKKDWCPFVPDKQGFNKTGLKKRVESFSTRNNVKLREHFGLPWPTSLQTATP